MALTAGSRLGPYEISAPIGAGGMGEVYKARDTRLDRSVAVKVLPAHIASREDLKARFEREARAVASLNHPNICTLFDIGNQDGVSFMVMELLEGERLAARIERGPIAVDSAVALARQIADALDRAHRAGVTHRDVKPGNIMITRDGVKVLDFGLAKSTGAGSAPDEKTMSAVLTTEGTVLGTPQYMAPEQFEGREADARCDIWAFGAVLYEMVTGQKAFQGKTYSSLVGAILAAEPAPMSVKPFTPRWLERLVLRCLSKDPEDRYQSIRDVVLDLRAPVEEAAPASSKATHWPWIAATVACAALAAIGWFRGSATPAAVRFDIAPSPGIHLEGAGDNGYGGGVAISPDGKQIVYTATAEKGQPMFYLRAVNSLEARPLPGTEGVGRPFWSPDSRSIGFVAGEKLKRIDIASGSVLALSEAGADRGGSWNERGEILFSNRDKGLMVVSASGGAAKLVIKLDREAGETFHYYPQFLPGGKEFLFYIRHKDKQKQGIYISALDGRRPALLMQSNFAATYHAPSRLLLFVRDKNSLFAQRMELNPPRLTGDPVRLADGVAEEGNNGYVYVSLSSDGTLVYARNVPIRNARLAWVDRAGKLLQAFGPAFPTSTFRNRQLSPDGKRIAYVSGGGSAPEIWTMQVDTGTVSRLTYRLGTSPVWSPDGRFLYFFNADRKISRKSSDGSGEEEVIGDSAAIFGAGSVSPDGKYLMTGTNDLMVLPLEGDRKPVPYLKTQYNEGEGVFSPDGKWVAYQSDESGRYEIYIQAFPKPSGKWQISAEGGRLAVWRRDGKELLWTSLDGTTVMAASIESTSNAVKPGKAVALFPLPYRSATSRAEPAPDGRRFLVVMPEGAEPPQLPLAVVMNWAAGLPK